MLQYVALFIVILAVMAAMNGFLFLMLRGLSRQLKEQVNSCFLRQLEFTDAIYEEKREKLNRLKEEENTFLGRASASPVKEQLDGPKETTVKTAAPVTVAVPAAAESDRQAGYINPSLIEDYRYIKEHFKVDTEEAYQNVMAEEPDQERIHHGNVCRHMYEILDFDTVYRIGLLAVPDQHEILYEIFDDDEDEVLRTFGESGQVKAKVVYFSSLRELPQGIFLRGKEIVLRAGEKEFVITTTDRLKILGRHNHENTMAAAAMAYYAGVSVESIHKSVCEFVAVPHRIEYVTEKNGVAYYNDSKGTNPDAAIKGIQAMNRPTLLIGGGYDKESSYDEWIESFDGKVRYLVLIGQTKEKIKAAAERLGFTDIILCEDLKEAVQICAEKANPGDAVLLSPACASWGQFDNYEQRGDMFKEYVKAL